MPSAAFDPPFSDPPMSPAQTLRWYVEAGVDCAVGEMPLDRYALAARAVQSRTPPAVPPSPSFAPGPAGPSDAGPAGGGPASAIIHAAARASAADLAQSCSSLDELKAAMEAYDGCVLKRTCQRTVFADGNPEARVMLIGEAPGADEDRLGRPFVGASGRLLDRMLASIGLDRSSAYIANVVPWRPPANRKPEPAEVELCLPFIARHIELVAPAILVFLGGAPANALSGRHEPISRLRGRWIDYVSPGLGGPVPAMPTFHPAYLLRTPLGKREVWRDLLAVRARLDGA